VIDALIMNTSVFSGNFNPGFAEERYGCANHETSQG
jgi:hypothetical protein